MNAPRALVSAIMLATAVACGRTTATEPEAVRYDAAQSGAQYDKGQRPDTASTDSTTVSTQNSGYIGSGH